MRLGTSFASLCLALAACAEIADDTASSPDASAPPADAGASPDAGRDADAGTPVTTHAKLVVNELRAKGEEFVELFNAGDIAATLGGWRITDTDASGAPRLDHALTFPNSITLAPGAFLVVLTNVASPRTGLQSSCGGTGASSCLDVGFGLSATNGDTIFVLDGTGQVVASGSYPPNAVGGGRAWGRIPDGSGAFGDVTPTPGAPNAP